MKFKITFFFLFLCMVGLITSQAQAQTVNVKMRLNTSTCLDTLRPTGVVQIRGESKKGTTPAVTWDGATGILLTNKGGDYWEGTFQAKPGDTLAFKFWTGFNASTGTAHWTGWDGDMDPGQGFSGNNRILVVGNSDTTLPLQYYNGGDIRKPQYWRPFESKTDTIAVYFRVNMGGADFNPSTQMVDVRGGAPIGTDSPWITLVTLQREAGSVNDGSFWSGVAYVAKSAITPGTTSQSFKFVIQPPDGWENTSDRSFTFSSLNDTTIFWYYFNNRAPSGPKVAANVLFRLKVDALEEAGIFDRSLGDKVGVTGPKGWAADPFDFDTDPTMLKMIYNADLDEWNLVEPFNLFPNEILVYKYYISWDTSRVIPENPNYIPGLLLSNGWEEPGFTGGADRRYMYTNQTEQIIPGDFGQDQAFFNSLDERGVIKTPITVTFNVNMEPATNVISNPTNPAFRPGVDTAFVQFDGSMVPVTQGLPMYGAENRLMMEDSDGNGIYTVTWDLMPPTFNQLCFHVVYSSTSGYIENGGGTQRGRRYYQYIHPAAIGNEITWPASFELNQIAWMNDSLTVEDPPTFTVSVDDEGVSPEGYFISQNYPNPFNPSTRITYHIPEHSQVKLQVYDITGKLVKVLSNLEQEAGTHIVSWNGTDENGRNIASGVYFLRITAGSYTNSIKMMMLK